MKTMVNSGIIKKLFSVFSVLLIFITASFSKDEGLWMPNQLAKLPWDDLQKRGMHLSVDQLYSESVPSIKDAVVILGEGTGSFVSDSGLILTNFHVVLTALQQASSPQQNAIKNGYTARKPEEEVPIQGYTAKILLSMKDVSSEVLSVLNDTMSPDVRALTIKNKIAELEAKGKGTSENECEVKDFFYGLKYYLNTYEVIRDVRLVVAPPQSIGAFGGEEDNWMWPRQCGDFALVRAYVAPDGKHTTYSKDNVPYKPKKVLPISIKGYKEGAFTFVPGYPGLTLRQLPSPGIQAAQDVTLPFLHDLIKAQLVILNKAIEDSPVDAINYATQIQSMSNTSKYIGGTLRAISKMKIPALRQADEIALWDHIFADSTLEEKYGTVLLDLDSAYTTYRAVSKKQIATGQMIGNIQLLRIASVFKDFANSFKEGEKPNPAYETNLTNFYVSSFKQANVEVDKELLTELILKAADLSDDQSIEAIKNIYGKKKFKEREQAIKKFVDKLYKETKVSTKDNCDKLKGMSPDKIRADVFVKFAIDFDKDFRKVKTDQAELDAKISYLLNKFGEVKYTWKPNDTYPDANRTLRFSYGAVKSYKPRSSVSYDYYTTLAGVLERESVTEDKFLVPPRLHKLGMDHTYGSYVDSTLGYVPVDFITDNDISGGSSGSPVLNGDGEIIGIEFDGNWEGMAGDYIFQEDLNRSINVDIRYLLFYLENYTGAKDVLQELKISK